MAADREAMPATAGQFAQIHALAPAAGLETVELADECRRLYGEPVHRLTREEARWFVGWLLARAKRLAREEAA